MRMPITELDQRMPAIQSRGGRIIVPKSLDGFGTTPLKPGQQIIPAPLLSIEQALQDLRLQGVYSAIPILRKSMVPRTVDLVANVAKLAIDVRGGTKRFIILNKASSVLGGIAASGTLVASALRNAGGNTQATALGVANYKSAHLYLNVTQSVGPGHMDFYAQTKDPVSGNWCDAQMVWSDTDLATVLAGGTGTVYGYIGPNGIGNNLAMRWDLLSGTSVTFSVGYILKDPLPGSSAGVAQNIYLGGNTGVTVTSGFPLLEGQTWEIHMEDNSQLYAIAETALTLNIFELQ